MGLNFGERKPIVIGDRGYPSKEFIKYVEDKEIKYVMRVHKKFTTRIDKMRSGSKSINLSEGIKTRSR
jgi:hypothetical protein